ncbi:MAG: PHP domain-containing protein [Clostridia bacterium]|nr:PHP domain-containing protein [Clostridia bacterium]
MNQTALSKLYPYRTELHAHTEPASLCGRLLPEALVELYLSLGAHGIVITNHLNAYSQGERTAEQYAEDYLADYYRAKSAAEGTSLSVSLGVEIRFDGKDPNDKNDYLIYGVESDEIVPMIEALDLGIEEFYKKFKRQDNLILQAHPFRDKITLAPLSAIDGIEVFNLHPGQNSRIAWAAKYAKENQLLMSGGSDVHRENRAASCFLRTSEPIQSSHDVVRALCSRDILFETWGNLIVPYYED